MLGDGPGEIGTHLASCNIVTTFGDTIYLKETATANENYDKLKRQFEEFAGETYQRLLAERTAQLTPEEIVAWEKPELDRSLDEMFMAAKVEALFTVPPDEVARALPEEERIDGFEMAHDYRLLGIRSTTSKSIPTKSTMPIGKLRCEAEQEDAAILVPRTSMYEANQMLDRGELDAAIAKYDEAWKASG
ncbi:MAG: hypothetical protein R3C56_27435 [Pirellulaceae bacterium]